MATTDLAAKRYAQAAFELALEAATLDQWAGALGQIASFMGEGNAASVLENTRVPVEDKQRLIDAALQDLPPLPLNLARLLVRKGRTALAGDISTEFKILSEQGQGISRARAFTAVPLDDFAREALTKRLQEQTGRSIILEAEIDPNLIGGLVIQLGDKLVDVSTKARLQALRESLTGAV